MSSTNRLNRQASAEAPSYAEQHPLRLLSWPQVQKLLAGRSSSSVRRDEFAGRFPRRVKIGPRQVGWFAHEIDSWLEELKNGTADHPNELVGD